MLDFFAGTIIALLPFVLSFAAIVLYCDLRFFPFSKIKKVFSLFVSHSDASSRRALSVALAGTLGVGNIVGVAYALSLAGAGALFWMWVSALLAMILKYSETLLAIHLKRKPRIAQATTETVGGAMYYIPHRPLAALFALLCVASSFTVGNLLQTKALTDAFSAHFSLSPVLIGIVLSLLTLWVIWRGIRRITQFCAFVIPFLSLLYLLMCLVVILKNVTAVPSLFAEIFKGAFSFRAFGGGVGSMIFFHAVKVGFSKGLITNEAGCGTAPIAHASAQTENGALQGIFGIVEVFFDTFVLCSASGLVLLLAKRYAPSLDGYPLVRAAFSGVLGRVADWLLPFCIFFFVLATLVSWSYYGKSALSYFTQNQGVQKAYLLLFSAVAFFGAIGKASTFWQLSDITLGLMTLINTGYLLYFRKEIRNETAHFLQNDTRLT